MRLTTPATVLALFATGVIVAGCGGDDAASPAAAPTTTQAATTEQAETSETSQTPATAGPVSGKLTVKMDEFSFTPKDSTIKAGTLKLTAPNVGKATHELVILRTNTDPAALPQKGGEVDESTSIGELADVAPGASKSGTFKLKAGKYAIVCNLPGHYAAGMYGSFTVVQ